ncbi:patatin-like phospholipase family protein [Nocardioides daejeonensis]|uniref:patatin-like phospholipase family protein n=1 Tax=Nocardioides daejeonensis TaxID=1046556 RepID=UPI000D746977|nr:patatin-like phospholipase family protein [Nocardioides daejeonensis]
MSSHTDVFVLSGGAARGAVQVGMAQTLIEAGIRPAALVGTSVGALNAAHLACHPGLRGVHQLAEQWLRLTSRDIFPGGTLGLLRHLAGRRPYLFGDHGLRSIVDSWLPVTRLEQAALPLRVVTTDLERNEANYHSVGDLLPLLLASAAVPGVFPPVELPRAGGGVSVHVDGGVADLVPVAGAREFGPTRVWILDASVPTRAPRATNPVEMVVASLGVATRVRPFPDLGTEVEVHHLSTPDLGVGMRDFSRTSDHLADGRRTAARLVERLHAGTPTSARPAA